MISCYGYLIYYSLYLHCQGVYCWYSRGSITLKLSKSRGVLQKVRIYLLSITSETEFPMIIGEGWGTVHIFVLMHIRKSNLNIIFYLLIQEFENFQRIFLVH